jgi:uncharacterized protein
MESKSIDLKIFLISFLAVVLIEFGAGVMGSRLPQASLAILGSARILDSLILLYIVYGRTGRFSALGLDRSRLLIGLKKGLIWAAGFAVFVGFFFVFLHLFGHDPFALIRTRIPEPGGKRALFFLVGGVVGPVAEELFFRGIIYGFFRRWGILPALSASTFFFVIFHVPGPVIPFTQITGGILFGISYEKEKCLMVPIVIHCLGNIAIFAFGGVSGF